MKPSEAQLCSDFITWVNPHGWVAYAETEAWDILLVHPETDEQIGIQAKAQANLEVIHQAIRYPNAVEGPDYRAVLVPSSPQFFSAICYRLGVVVIERLGDSGEFISSIGSIAAPMSWEQDTGPRRPFTSDSSLYWGHPHRHLLPTVVPDVKSAGTASPLRMTEWKMKALKICAILELRGHLVPEDFKIHGIDRRRWMDSRWLDWDETGRVLVRGPNLKFDIQMPDAYQRTKELLAPVDIREPEPPPRKR